MTSLSTVKQSAKEKILITAALPYANGPIHLGHLLEYLQADFWVRFHKMHHRECLYFCADDAHGTPIMLKAREKGMEPEDWIAQNQKEHQKDFADFLIHFDHYSSTHSEENKKLCQEIYEKMKAKGHIFVKEVKQPYCENCKMWLPDRFLRGNCPFCETPNQYGDTCDQCGKTYHNSQLKSPSCSLCKQSPQMYKKQHDFFHLNAFREKLKAWLPSRIHPEIHNKLKEWLQEPLKDWDISRDSPYFGFRIPHIQEERYFYVWLDAPIGYIATTDQWCQKHGRNLKEFWDTQKSQYKIYHFIGKDIVYFHSLFWPAMLMNTDFKTPDYISVHGFLTMDGKKMSKSRGTFITARQYLDMSLDPLYLRYFLASKLSSKPEDLDLSWSEFEQKINAELIGKIVNLGSRSLQMLHKQFNSQLQIQREEPKGKALLQQLQEASKVIFSFYEERSFARVIQELCRWAEVSNRYFDKEAPWKRVKENPADSQHVLSIAANAFRLLSIYLQPILPTYSQRVGQFFHDKTYTWESLKHLHYQGTLAPFEPLLVRVDKKKAWSKS